MAREIKFRAWDKSNRIMLEWQWKYDIGLSGIFADKYILISHAVDCGDHQELSQDPFKKESYELMQFTGLKDKNGKEIYEGDIVNNSVASWEVKFNKGCFCGDMIKPNPLTADTLIALRAIKDIFIIGNIYENPELIK